MLVVSQVALSLVLLVGSLLFVRTLRNLLTLDPGFRQDNTIVVSLDLSRNNIPAAQRQEYKRNLLERVRTIPGVDGAADVSIVPVSGNGWNENIFIAGDQKRTAMSFFDRVSPGYFAAMKTPLLAGRDFDNRDTASSPKVAIVNETFVRKHPHNGENPIGMTFREDTFVGQASPIYQIVGFVKDTKYMDLREEPRAIAFVAQMQDDTSRQLSTVRDSLEYASSIRCACNQRSDHAVRRPKRSSNSICCRPRFAIRCCANA